MQPSGLSISSEMQVAQTFVWLSRVCIATTLTLVRRTCVVLIGIKAKSLRSARLGDHLPRVVLSINQCELLEVATGRCR